MKRYLLSLLSLALLSIPFSASAVSAPTITGITHTSSASLLYTITGTGFQKGARLLIGGSAPVSLWRGGTQFLVFQPPLNKTGTVDVQVTNPDGGKVVKKGGFTYPSSAVKPVIRGVAPNAGSTVLKTVWGSNFDKGAKVYVNGTLAPSQWQVGTQYIVFQPPAGTPSGNATVTVKGPTGIQSLPWSGNMNVAAPMTPVAGSTGTVSTTLTPRDLDGNPATIEAYYDSTQNITWLANANAGAGSSFDNGQSNTDGRMTWDNAMGWTKSLSFPVPGAESGWRLPTMVDVGKPGCPGAEFSLSGGTACGQNVIVTPGSPNSSEMGFLYLALGNKPSFSTTPGAMNPKPWLVSKEPFSGINDGYDQIHYGAPGNCDADSRNCRDDAYWYNLSDASSGGSSAWKFLWGEGEQIGDSKNVEYFAWAVHDGDVGNKVSGAAVISLSAQTGTQATYPTPVATYPTPTATYPTPYTGGTGSGGGTQSFAGQFFLSMQEPGVNGWMVGIHVSPFDGNTVLVGGDLFGTAYSTNGGKHWNATTGIYGDGGGTYTWHPTNPNIVWAAVGRGPHLSTDGGKTWTLKRDGMPAMGTTVTPGLGTFTAETSIVLFDPSDSTHQTVLAFGGTQARGNAHTATQNSDNSVDINNNIDPRWSNGVIWRSTNGGDHWSQFGVIPGNAAIDMASFAADGHTVYAATYAGLYKSIDSGAHWSLANSGLNTSGEAFGIATHPTDPNVLWAVNTFGTIYKSTDAAASWSVVAETGDYKSTLFPLVRVAVSPHAPDVVYASSPSGLWMSTQGGDKNTWTKILDPNAGRDKVPLGTAYQSVGAPAQMGLDLTDPTASTLYIWGSVPILKTTNRGATWTEVSATPEGNGAWRGNGFTGDVSRAIKFNPLRPGQIFLPGGDANRAMHSNDYGWSWFARSPGIGIWGGSWDATFSKDGTVYLGPGNGDYIIPSDFMDDGSGRQVVYRSTDGGDTWSKVPLPSGLSGDVKAVYTLPNNSNYVWAGVSGKNKGARILRSTDRGMTWTDVTGPSVGNLGRIFCIVPDASDPTGLTFYVGTQGIYDPENPANGGVYKTTDGVHFTMMSGSPISSVNVSIAVANSSTIYATAYGKGLSKFNGSSWSTVINSPYVYGVAVDPGNTQRVAASTFDFSTMDLYRSDGVMISSDGGASWSNIKAGLQVLSVNPVAFNPDGSGQLVVGVDGGGAFVTDVGNSTPFSGSPASIPGTIQAENFDNGGADVAYHASGGAPSRSSVTGLVAHDWIKYRVAVTAGTYDITVHGSGGTVHLEMNGVNITGPQSLNGDTTITGVDLSGGTQYLKLYVESGNVSVDSVRFDQR